MYHNTSDILSVQVVESDDNSGDNDDKVIVAMGVLNTIESVLTVIEDSPEILMQIEPIILQIIGFIIQTQCMGGYYAYINPESVSE